MKITPDDIKKAKEKLPKRKCITLTEYFKLKELYNGEPFDMVYSAYALGFARGVKTK